MYLKSQNGHVSISTLKTFVAENEGQHQPLKHNATVNMILGNAEEKKKNQGLWKESSLFVIASEPLSSLPPVKDNGKDVEVEGATDRKSCLPARQRGFSDREEIEKKFETLSFAFKTDSSTIEKRLSLLKRKRDQAETNVKNEVGTIRNKLKELELFVSGVDIDQYNAMLDMKKELDFLLKAASQLTSGAEDYGYVQHEKKTLDFVAVMVQHVDNLAARRKETMSSLDELQTVGQRLLEVSPFVDVDGNERKTCNNSEGAHATEQWSTTVVPGSTLPTSPTVPFGGRCRRRASIAALPRAAPTRAVRTITALSANGFLKAFSLSRLIHTESGSQPTLIHEMKIQRKRQREITEEAVDDTFRQSTTRTEKDCGEYSGLFEPARVYNRIGLHSESMTNPISPEPYSNHSHSRRLFREIFQLVRWPDRPDNRFQFYLTRRAVSVLILVFLFGFFLGFHGYFVGAGLRCLFAWVAVLTFCMIVHGFYRLLIGLFMASALLLVASLFWLGKSSPRTWTAEEIDRVLGAFGMEVEVRYGGGPPPV